MPKIHSETLTITLSRLVKKDTSPHAILSKDLLATIEEVMEQLVGDQAVVEIDITTGDLNDAS